MPDKVQKDNTKKKRIDSLKRFFTETRLEFKKIVWPTPKQTFDKTVVVLATIVLIGLFISGLDALTSLGLSSVLNKL